MAMKITRSEASELIARLNAAADEGRMLDVMMPNGKPLGECTGEEISQFARAMDDLGLPSELLSLKSR
jgi:hypothetical protein